MVSKLGLALFYKTRIVRDGFHTNLISFGQLLTNNSLVGQVTDRLIVLQDRTKDTDWSG